MKKNKTKLSEKNIKFNINKKQPEMRIIWTAEKMKNRISRESIVDTMRNINVANQRQKIINK